MMMKKILLLGIVVFFLYSCQDRQFPDRSFSRAGGKVELIEEGNSYQLKVDDQPYFVRGAGGRQYLDELQQIGGNTIRTWSTAGLDTLLDQAHAAGLKVLVGLDVVPGRQGLDYSDQKAVEAQKERIRKSVMKYKDHPGVLMWSVGNELGLFYVRDELYIAINDLAKMIHEIDPDHPVTISVGIRSKWIDKIALLCPEVDILSLNVFSPLPELKEIVSGGDFAWKGPYMVTEWSSKGYWEVPFVDWDAPVEPMGKKKAAQLIHWYQASIGADKDRCLGSFVFYWGNKQERTHTWFSMFSSKGEKTSRVDALYFLWNGKWPENRAPEVDSLRIIGSGNHPSKYLFKGEIMDVRCIPFDADGDSLSIEWEVLVEGDYRNIFGGDKEQRPQSVPSVLIEENGSIAKIKVPEKVGAYRLFVNVRDQKNGFGSANIPFYVLEGSEYPEMASGKMD